jgi:hypothetical protein
VEYPGLRARKGQDNVGSTKETSMRIDDVKPGQKFMTVQKLGSGWAAVLMWLNNEDYPGETFFEPWETGIGRYATREEALLEAREWAYDETLALVGEDE